MKLALLEPDGFGIVFQEIGMETSHKCEDYSEKKKVIDFNPQHVMGSCASDRRRIHGHNVADIAPIVKPSWTQAVEVKSVYLQDKISQFSQGIRAINNNTIELTGSGKSKVEGAQWSRGFTSGKHIIEFIFPIHLRTKHSRVGLAPEGTNLGGNDLRNVVGGKDSWAVDVKSRILVHNARNVGSFPSRKKVLPDWFFMFIDLDTGTLQFGSDIEFFGTAFTGVQSNKPLYPMVTASGKGAIIGIVYRGKGKEIEGPLRKNRTLAAVRRTDRAKERERVCEKQNTRMTSIIVKQEATFHAIKDEKLTDNRSSTVAI